MCLTRCIFISGSTARYKTFRYLFLTGSFYRQRSLITYSKYAAVTCPQGNINVAALHQNKSLKFWRDTLNDKSTGAKHLKTSNTNDTFIHQSVQFPTKCKLLQQRNTVNVHECLPCHWGIVQLALNFVSISNKRTTLTTCPEFKKNQHIDYILYKLSFLWLLTRMFCL